MTHDRLPPAPPDPTLLIPALMRSYLESFLPWAFHMLHQGKPPLVMHWYLKAMCQSFQRVATGGLKRLVINVPPRNLKSITSVAFTAWMLGRNPRLKIMLVTYGASLSREHIENCRTLMNLPLYRRLFPATLLVPGGKGEVILRTTLGGGCRSVTVGGATTGFGADIILIDDAMKADDIASAARREELERFYTGTLITRLNDKQHGIIISIQQRLGEHDLPARLIEAGAEHLCLPAYDDVEQVYDIGFGRRYRRPIGEVLRPGEESREVLDQLRRDMGPVQFAAQYLQKPMALEGDIIRTEAFRRFDLDAFGRHEYDKIVQSWDLATSEALTADCSVCMTIGLHGDDWHILHVDRFRQRYPVVRDRVVANAELWGADKILLEDASAGQHLYQDLTEKGRDLPLFRVRPEGDKITRMVGQLAMIEDGRVWLTTAYPDQTKHPENHAASAPRYTRSSSSCDTSVRLVWA